MAFDPDADAFERLVIYRYRVSGDEVTRVGQLAANARGDKSKIPPATDRIKYRVVTKDGVANEKIAPKGIEFLQVDAFEKKLREDIASGKK